MANGWGLLGRTGAGQLLMRLLLGLLLVAQLGLVRAADTPATGASAAEAAAADVQGATLMIAQRPVVQFRVPFAGSDPASRASRAQARVKEVIDRGIAAPVEAVPLSADGRQGMALRIGEVVVFVVIDGDVEPGGGRTLEATAEAARRALGEAIEAHREQRRWPVLLKGVAVALLATVVLAAALWATWALTNWLGANFSRMLRGRVLSNFGRYGSGLLLRLSQVLALFVSAALLFAWLEVVLDAFPASRPLSERLVGLVGDAAQQVISGLIDAVPGLIVVAVIALVAQGVAEVSNAVFRGIEQGRLSMPGLHPDTAGASRQLAVVLIWALALVAAFPYLPGSDTNVFKGVSVFLGAVITLGSSGVVQQAMSGLVLVYSRALKVGEYVVVGSEGSSVEGAVVEVGALATKLAAATGEIITVPNAVLVGNSVRNFSRQPGQGSQVSTTVTIGYDAPWRLVHQMLLRAAAETPGLRESPKPFILQRALNDFYVAYELRAYIDRPIERLQILSTLHARIQDAFNAQGVQIMSPHFLAQPEQAVVVPPEAWDPPLKKPGAPG
ncbi:mechanosensitive ion channel family protein [Rivibacter subsaxonicus]|uniref:Small-conductance mechanosensitive channel n=1 Tax=Rivibacter subsaxonicus TaxID=457575 RepID=A0A4V2FTG7_9BURK|nr:mechanosensitive ion channel domain-containing protein [Rivibacter subsaxonicus]RZT97805.1 small-conductance mechanosensitive channel [Rivibacter subsaxonicus]